MIAARALAPFISAAGLLAAAGPAEEPDLKRAEAEADRTDPGWRFEEIQARRAKLPAAKNGAPVVAGLIRALTKEWREIDATPKRASPFTDPANAQEAWDALMAAIADDPTRPVPPKALAALAAARTRLDPILARAPELEKYPGGYTPLAPARNPMEIALPFTQDARMLVRALSFQGHARAAAGDVDGALASARAILGVSRAVGDEPFAISQLVRMAFESVAVDLIERALARGVASDSALAATQAALADEAAEPLLLYALRGERAVAYDLGDKLATGRLDVRELSGTKPDKPAPGGKEIAFYRGEQAILLDQHNRAVAIARKPLPEQPALFERWEADLKANRPSGLNARGAIAHVLMPALGAVSQAHMRTRALLRSAETAIALERVRLARGRWPKPGESLAPAFKDGPPADPFTGKPIAWKATPTGLVVYSVSYDRRDDGGRLDNSQVRRIGTDIGVRLWDADRRPKPARPR